MVPRCWYSMIDVLFTYMFFSPFSSESVLVIPAHDHHQNEMVKMMKKDSISSKQ